MFGKNIQIWNQHLGYVTPRTTLDIKDIEFINESPNKNPGYTDLWPFGFDIRAWIQKDEPGVKINKDTGNVEAVLKDMEKRTFHTGLYFKLPEFTEIQCRSVNDDIMVNYYTSMIPGDIHRELLVSVVNLSGRRMCIQSGDIIANGVVCPVYTFGLVNFREKKNNC